MGYHKLEELKQEAGKISNIDIQKLIARVFYYLCVVTLQYVTPMVMVLFLSLMYKTMGGGSWTGFWSDPSSVTGTPTPNPKISLEVVPNDIKIDKVFGQEEYVEALSSQFSLAWHSLKHVSLLCTVENEKFNEKHFSSNQLFSNFFSKTIAFTKFCRKM